MQAKKGSGRLTDLGMFGAIFAYFHLEIKYEYIDNFFCQIMELFG